jgi:membrane-bound lytic murein transglycosylase A
MDQVTATERDSLTAGPAPATPKADQVKARRRLLFVVLLASGVAAALAMVLVLSGLVPIAQRPVPDEALAPPEIVVEHASFAQLPRWTESDHRGALTAFVRSCERLLQAPGSGPANPAEALGEPMSGKSLGGQVADWREPCVEAQRLAARGAAREAAAARAFFESRFTPAKVLSLRRPLAEAPAGLAPRREERGLITGYFEPEYEARAEPDGEFSAPLLARPDDLVTADLGRFREEFAGERIAGFVEGGALLPYPDRAEIEAGALGNRARPLAYLHPDDLFFLQIQGSGRLRFPDGTILRVGYDGQNGHPYTAIGRTLIERGALALENVSMQTIRQWLAAASPDEASAVRRTNRSYVFFRPLTLSPAHPGESRGPEDGSRLPPGRADLKDDLGPLGTQGVQLTPKASLAVDRRFHALGAPLFLAFEGPEAPLTGLYVAQDTGGAIKGPLRGDIFFGAGEEAAEIAGRLKAQAQMYVLLPNAVAARLWGGA